MRSKPLPTSMRRFSGSLLAAAGLFCLLAGAFLWRGLPFVGSALAGLAGGGLLCLPVLRRRQHEADALRVLAAETEAELAGARAELAAQNRAMLAQQQEREENAQSLAQINTLLAQASGRFQELFQGLPVACVCYDRQGGIMEWNREFERLYERSDLFGQSIWETIYVRDEAPQIEDAVTAVLTGETCEGIEWTHRRANGSAAQLYCSIFPLRDAGGEITGAISADVDITAQHQAEEALRASEERLHALYNTTSQQEVSFEAKLEMLLQRGGEQFGLEIGLLTRQTEDRHEVVQAWSPRGVILPGAGYPLGEAHGPAALALAREGAGDTEEQILGVEATLGAPVRVNGEVWGMLCFAGIRTYPVPFASGDREMIRLMAQWIGGEIGRRKAEDAIRESEEKFRSAIASMSEGLIVMDTEGVIRLCNESAEHILDLTRGEVQKWKPLNPTYVAHREDGSPFPQGSYPLVVSLRSGLPQRDVVMGLPRPDGRLLWVSVNSNPLVRPGEDTPYAVVATFSDITERRRDEDKIAAQMTQIKEYAGVLEFQKQQLEAANCQLEELAMRDSLTGLGNRRAFSHRLELEMGRAARYATPLSLIIFDVDRFKDYNDTFGHPAGDEVLKHLAFVLTEQGRETDFFARYGGEEFAVLLPHTDSLGATIVAERLREAIEASVWPCRPVTASFGTATLQPAMSDETDLIGEADRALYAAKAAGRNRAIHVQSLPGALPDCSPALLAETI